jgi:hypothetical protein
MKQITLNIPDNKYPFFMELVKSLSFVKVSDESMLTEEQLEFVEGTKKSLDEVEKHLKGEIKLKSANQLLDEL